MTAHNMAGDRGRTQGAQEASGSTSPAPQGRSWLIRRAEPGDEDQLLALIQALAKYEREPDAVKTTPPDLAVALFPSEGTPLAHALVAEWQQPDAARAIFGLALLFVTFSTWTGRHGIWLEDLFVAPSGRGCGAGKALLEELAAECRRRGYARLDWAVLDWNTEAQ